MSGSVSGSIPASQVVDIVPNVLNGGGSALDLVGLMLTTNSRAPLGMILSFTSADAVGNYFGLTSQEYNEAAVYFAGFIGSNSLPGTLLVAQYNTVAVSAYLRGASIANLTLAQLQALTGSLSVTIDGVVKTAAAISLAAVTSFSGAAATIGTALGISGPTQATVTGAVGATFTGLGNGTNLTASNVTGLISIGDTVNVGAGVTAGTIIESQTSGTPGGAGIYVTNQATTIADVVATTSSLVFVVSASDAGTVAVGQYIQTVAGATEANAPFINAELTGTGGVGNYTLSSALSYFAAGTATLGIPGVQYDSQSGAMIVTSETTGATSSVSFATGTLATLLNLTQNTGAVTSLGAVVATPSTFMTGVTKQTMNWASLFHIFDPDGGNGNTQKLLFAAWINAQGNRFLYVPRDTSAAPTVGPAPTSLGATIKASAMSGISPVYEPADGSSLYLAAFLSGFVASIDFTEFQGRATAAFKGQSGLVPSVYDADTAANLAANGYNFYGDYATSNQTFQWFMNGIVSGQFQWIDTYINQIWMSNQFQLALMTMLGQYKSIPYNATGNAIIRAALSVPITAAVNFGAVQSGVALSAAQAQYVNNAAGMKIDTILGNQGWYLQIGTATAQVRQARQSPPMTFWYMDGGSVQQIQLASVTIQ